MKRKCVLLHLLIIAVLSVLMYGAVQKDIYVRSFPAEKVFTHKLGYAVLYHRPSGQGYGMIYLPYSWFTRIDGAGQVIFDNNPSYPYFSIFWVGGEFSHIKLYVHANSEDSSWGRLNASAVEVGEKFAVTPETFNPEF